MRQPFYVSYRHEPVVNLGLEVTPGLAIVETGEATDPWCIIHVRSGCAIAFGEHPEQCAAAVMALAPLIDWTLSGDEIVADPTLTRSVRLAAVSPSGCWLSTTQAGRRDDIVRRVTS